LISTATTASAHVKWFVDCNVSDDPLPAQAVFTPTFFLFLSLFLTLFYLASKAERTALGATVSGFLDHWTQPLHGRADDLLRAAAAVSFALLWADGGLILTPGKGNGTWLTAIQLLIPAYLFGRAALRLRVPASSCSIPCGVATYSLFHAGLPVFSWTRRLFRSPCRRTKIRFRFLFLRWTLALSLLARRWKNLCIGLVAPSRSRIRTDFGLRCRHRRYRGWSRGIWLGFRIVLDAVGPSSRRSCAHSSAHRSNLRFR
jgi:hypothetical protein